MVDQERDAQDARWGKPPREDLDPCEFLAILMEEVGEVAKALVEYQADHELITELVHVSAVAQQWIEDILLKE